MRWSGSVVGRISQFLKAGVALVLCLGTMGVVLSTVGVLPAAAAGVPTVTAVEPIGGLPTGGGTVILLGTNFTGSTVVDFGAGNPATFVVNSVGKITVASAPANIGDASGTVCIKVTNASGTSTCTGTSNYYYEPAPTVTQLYGGSSNVLGGVQIIIQGTNFYPVGGTASAPPKSGTTITFGNVPAIDEVFTVISTTQIEATVPPMSDCSPSCISGTFYNLTVTTGSGVSPNSGANTWYWFGQGICNFSGTNVQTGGPPGSTDYFIGAAPGTATNSSTGTSTASSVTFTDVSSAPFAPSDVGDPIFIQGAGPSGGNLVTTIATYVSATQIDLAAMASANGSGELYIFGLNPVNINCSNLQNLGTLAPFLVSLADPMSASVTGVSYTCGDCGATGGPGVTVASGGNETWLGWTGQNG